MDFQKYFFNVPCFAMTVVTAAACFFLAVSIMAVSSHEKIKRFDEIYCDIYTSEEPVIDPHISGMGYIGKIPALVVHGNGNTYNVTVYSHPPPYLVNQRSAKKAKSIMDALKKKGRVRVKINDARLKAYPENINIRNWGSALFCSIVILVTSVVFLLIFHLCRYPNKKKECCAPAVVSCFTCRSENQVEPENKELNVY